ncbi:hypothetical protein V1L54_01415 [Streptomyces sp. TRM 70361]|uniref:hypothetical protein n=1 Tax=Streptomyces sp. TRM 70361 TaxID=3116553 RepID=UPI002E7AD508|nr:hypothetical protein [Streptomyces sp. TRM 70361]MEE1938088.1 hypothetical protein [Streptomyces sp. TRM 70361]
MSVSLPTGEAVQPEPGPGPDPGADAAAPEETAFGMVVLGSGGDGGAAGCAGGVCAL